MQTLDLSECLKLTGLPKGISGLIALQVHCDDDIKVYKMIAAPRLDSELLLS